MEDLIPASAFPVRLGAIDIGSNAIRMFAAQFANATTMQPLDQLRLPVRLGHDVFVTGQLTEEAMEAAVAGLQSFSRRLNELGVTGYRAVATSAVRDSRNGATLIERARAEAGVSIEVITGSEEARLVHLAVRNRIKLGRGKWLLADLGGGSLEVSVVDDHGIYRTESHEMGSVRLLEELGEANDDPARFRRRLEEYTATLRNSRVLNARLAGFIATGGNIESLARLAAAPQDGKGVATLRTDDLRGLADRLATLSYAERVEQLDLRPDRADVILPAAMVYERLAVLTRADAVLVPMVGVKDGVLWDLVEQHAGGPQHRPSRERAAIAGAISLGRRFHFDEAHARHVARLSTSLFDQTRKLHQLKREDRRLLIVAALLHDIGTFIGFKRHHKHALYVITESDLPALSPVEIVMVANIARYHRKNTPAPHHESFMSLDEKNRERVMKLSALLRIADALDREHLQRVESVQARSGKDTLELTITGRGDLLLERWALQRKVQFFEKVYKVGIQLGTTTDRP